MRNRQDAFRILFGDCLRFGILLIFRKKTNLACRSAALLRHLLNVPMGSHVENLLVGVRHTMMYQQPIIAELESIGWG